MEKVKQTVHFILFKAVFCNYTIKFQFIKWVYSRKKSKREFVDGEGSFGEGSCGHTFLKSPWNFSFFTLPLEILDKRKHYPCIFQGQNPRPPWMKIPHYSCFLVTLENSTSFLINPWKFHMPII